MKVVLVSLCLLVITAVTATGCSGEIPVECALAAEGARLTEGVPTPSVGLPEQGLSYDDPDGSTPVPQVGRERPPQHGGAEFTSTSQAPDLTESSPVSAGRESPWLPAILGMLPASVADSGVWLSNPVPAWELAGLEAPRSGEEWMSWTPEKQEDYWDAQAGIPRTSMHYAMRHTYPEWDEAFGFGAWDVSAMAVTGKKQEASFEVNVLKGEFDSADIQGNLLGLGYKLCSHSGGEYLALPEGARPDLDWLTPFTLYSDMHHVFATDQVVLTAPTIERMEELMSVRGGETPSLAEDPAFGDLVFSISDPLSVSILNRRLVSAPERADLGVGSLERPDEWGSLGSWEALSASFSRPSPELQRIAFSLWYAELADAQEAVPELSRRFDPLDPYLKEICADYWETEAFDAPRGAILEVSCQVKEGPSTEGLGSMMHSMLRSGKLGFLVN